MLRGYRVGGLAVPMLGLALAGCMDGGEGKAALAAAAPDPLADGLFSAGRDGRAMRGRPNRTQPGMREAPELFAASGTALWDGHPTLEGLWIAHPGTEIGHRVRVRNARTGTIIDAALLPLRSRPDAEMVISAEAADALGLLPSVPAELELVALEWRTGTGAGTPPPAGERPADRTAAAPSPAPDTPISGGST